MSPYMHQSLVPYDFLLIPSQRSFLFSFGLFIKSGCIYNSTVGHVSKTVLPVLLVGSEMNSKVI